MIKLTETLVLLLLSEEVVALIHLLFLFVTKNINLSSKLVGCCF